MLNVSRGVAVKFTIEYAETDKAIIDTYSVVKQLRPGILKKDYLRRVKLQRAELGFRLAALSENGQITCVAGFRICRSLGWGKFLYVDDLVTDGKRRSNGAGKAMLKWLVELARKERCDEVRLDSAVYRHEAHRFYLRERMDIACFNFRLDLRKPRRNEVASVPN
jgi:GNAT superfamily N-acetyltransferase